MALAACQPVWLERQNTGRQADSGIPARGEVGLLLGLRRLSPSHPWVTRLRIVEATFVIAESKSTIVEAILGVVEDW